MQRLSWFAAGAISVLIIFLLMDGRREETHHEHHDEESKGVKVTVEAQKLLGIRTTQAVEATLRDRIPVVGEIAQDPERIAHVVSPEAGVIASLNAVEGTMVQEGAALAEVRPKGGGPPIAITSPISGVVLAGHAEVGDRVDTVTSLYTVADLSSLPANFNVYEKDIGRVRMGQRIVVGSIAYPEKSFGGRITFISPRVEEDTHTIRIRAVVENPEHLLKLGMFVEGEVICDGDKAALVVPSQAIYTLEGKNGVFVKKGPDSFEARLVTVGATVGDDTAVVSGLQKGEEVASENAFLLKSDLLKSKMGAGCAE
jgi:cobalt-zinc-cadmium efflux system membrane fusion protein